MRVVDVEIARVCSPSGLMDIDTVVLTLVMEDGSTREHTVQLSKGDQ